MSNGKNSNGSCGVLLILLMIITGIAEIIKENYTLLIIMIAVIILGLIIWTTYKKENEVSRDDNIVIPNIRREENNYRISIEGTALTTGQYLCGRDIEEGIYNIRVLKGSGSIKVVGDAMFNQHMKEGQCFNNIEILKGNMLTIDMSMKVDFFNRRDVPEYVRISDETAKRFESEIVNNQLLEINMNFIEGHDFEYYCAELLEKYGFSNATVTRGSGDQGVDIVAEKDKIKYAIQCKRYDQPVGNKAVQEVAAGRSFYNCNAAIVMTNSTFTSSAIELADKLGVTLWDGNFLRDIILKKIAEDSAKKKPHANIQPKAGSKIYPPGIYYVGTSIKAGGYIIKCRNEDAKAEVWGSFEEHEILESSIICVEPHGDDYFLTLCDGQYMILENADMMEY